LEYSATLIGTIIFIALAFDFMNGFHDAANSIATIVSTRVLKPQYAVIWAAFFNFIAFIFFGLHVANTVGRGIVDVNIVDPIVVLAALVAALIWNIVTWIYGIPSSSSHALIGGLIGSALIKAGVGSLEFQGITKVLVSIVLSPLVGFILAFTLMGIVSRVFFYHNPTRIHRASRKLQLLSASLYSIGHGGNDAQKTMGIIAVLLYTSGQMHGDFHVPFWVVIACQLAMGVGTLFGGWRIVETMGLKIAKLTPLGGCCAETSGAITLFAATALGAPVSTTHTITGAIMGVGSLTKLSAVRWGVAKNIVWAWILTIPVTATISAITWYFCQNLR
jgi:inorganic phosphate transporter, PiT family